jgi:hypothetical protein
MSVTTATEEISAKGRFLEGFFTSSDTDASSLIPRYEMNMRPVVANIEEYPNGTKGVKREESIMEYPLNMKAPIIRIKNITMRFWKDALPFAPL